MVECHLTELLTIPESEKIDLNRLKKEILN